MARMELIRGAESRFPRFRIILAAVSAWALFGSPAFAANPLEGSYFYGDPTFKGNHFFGQPVAMWFGTPSMKGVSQAGPYVDEAARIEQLPILVVFNIPDRDCGGASSGGAANPDEYTSWIRQFAWGLRGRRAVVILEPDALAMIGAPNCSRVNAEDRYKALRNAVQILKQDSSAAVYIDAGHAEWIPAQTMALRLERAGVGLADGFSLNVSNFYSNDANIRYGDKVSGILRGKHFVVDTSRNGSTAVAAGKWCNPSGAALGTRPTSDTHRPLVDAFLWIKPPGESDGYCNGGPAPGAWWPEYAQALLRNARTW